MGLVADPDSTTMVSRQYREHVASFERSVQEEKGAKAIEVDLFISGVWRDEAMCGASPELCKDASTWHGIWNALEHINLMVRRVPGSRNAIFAAVAPSSYFGELCARHSVYP